ncbi:RNA polymerase sigma factor [Parafilimonas terrae]|uniref:RNA polymerase, sigma subunit, ECF family n=1 Tax=Parafilimonas terrae TaxID=1465490 RepID=A0A1I5Z8L2_9BACT|nr:sigma-70 family RNA polymerase sigma factor [Parafilimonas terrae]SFQ52437.1 RNA polymerase, sigma subunit, ECF family [Parafilimonas terrae]
MYNLQQQVDQLYKKQYGKMIAMLLYCFRDMHMETAEDVVQDTFSSALTSWSHGNMPENMEGWLFKVCRNKAINKLKEKKHLPGDAMNSLSIHETIFPESLIKDQGLKLLFACAHPELSPKAQVVITLKYVINLKVEPIAKILAMSIDGIDKLLVRSRQKIKDEKILFKELTAEALEQRLPIVHKILYLVFNEGYKSSWGKQLIREELCEDALIMTKILLESSFANKETQALFALMLFNAARLKSRFSADGVLLDLEEQDRRLWNEDLIMLGWKHLHDSKDNVVSPYHYEASIAYLHCNAAGFKSTDWNTIKGLYLKLLQLNSNPFIELNYAIALYYAGKKEDAFSILKKLEQNAFMHQYHLLNTALGKLYLLEGDKLNAKKYLALAATQTNMLAEKIFIERLMRRIDED